MKDAAAVQKQSYFHIGNKQLHKAWIILIGCCFLQASTLAPIMGCAGNFFVPICNELGCARSEISLYMTAYWLSMIPALPICGRIMTRFDMRAVTTICTIALVIAVAAMSVYTAPWMWIMSGIVFGTFGCCVFTIPLVTMINNWFHKKAGVAMGIATAVSALAIVILSPILQSCIANFGWRTAYLVEAGIVAVFSLPWTIFVFRADPKDWNAHPYGLTKEVAESLNEKLGYDFDDNPGVPLKTALKSIPFFCVFVFAGIAAMIGSGFDSHLPGYAISLGFTPEFGAYMVSALAFGSFCEKLLMGWVNDKFGVWVGVGAEFVMVSIGLVCLIALREPTLLIFFTALFGVQDSFTNVSLPLIVRKVFGSLEYTEIFAWARMGAAIFGSFAAVLVGLSYDVSGSYIPAFLGALVLVVIGSLLIFVTAKTGKSLKWYGSRSEAAEAGVLVKSSKLAKFAAESNELAS